jgi:hypothetical protein
MKVRLVAVLLGCVGALVGWSSSASAAVVGPPFTYCPAVFQDTAGCEYVVEVTAVNASGAATAWNVYHAPTSGPFAVPPYDGTEDTLGAIVNDATSPLTSVVVGIVGDGAFQLDGDGICNPGGPPIPAGCPFGPGGNQADPFDYWGPDTQFPQSSIDTNGDFATVTLPTPLPANGGNTYFSTELEPGAPFGAGGGNTFVTTTQTGGTPTPQTGANVSFATPTDVTDKATITGPNSSTAGGNVTYSLYSDGNCHTLVAGSTSTKAVTAGVAAASTAIGHLLPNNHVYYWKVTYSGQTTTHNSPGQSLCGDETLTFGTPPQPAVSTLASNLTSNGGQQGSSITVPQGGTLQVTDQALLVGGTGAVGNMTYTVYTNSLCSDVGSSAQTATQYASLGTVAVTNGVAPASLPLLAPPAGTYYFEARYSGDVNHAPAVSCNEVLTVNAPPPPPPPPPAPNSTITLISPPQVNPKTGQITITDSFPQAGRANWQFVIPNGKNGVFARVTAVEAKKKKPKKCKAGQIKLRGRCHPATAVYGKGQASVQPGTFVITVSPGAKIRNALSKGKTFHVTGTITFQSSLGGSPGTQTVSVTVHGQKPKKKKKH